MLKQLLGKLKAHLFWGNQTTAASILKKKSAMLLLGYLQKLT